MCWKRYHIIFSTISLKFKCKMSVQKEVIHSLKKKFTFWSRDQLRTDSFEENGSGLKNLITIILFKTWPTNSFLKASHITFIFMKMMSHDLLVQMAYWRLLWWSIFHKRKESYRLMTYYSNQANKWNGHREFLCYRFLWLFLVVNLLIKSLPSSREEKVVKEKSDDKTYRSRYFLQSSK